MESITDWIVLWRELVEIKARSRKAESGTDAETDFWRSKARAYDELVKRRWAKSDSSRAFILSQLEAHATVLDIGAGTGAWAALLARRARCITALEPSSAMIDVLRDNLAAEAITNVNVVQGAWPDVSVELHDFSLCAHAMYGCPDFPAFIGQMIASTRRMCFLILRASDPDGVKAEVARHLWGHPLDSPNFTIAYNSLLQMGIYPNVLMEDPGLWEPRISASLEAALHDLKQHFGLSGCNDHDAFITALLRRRLIWQNGQYIWPREVRSALVYWAVEHTS